MKFIVVTGGVVSGLGKGITISSIGRILKASGLRVTSIKIDPYLNTDAGTMSPFEHGETFVLDDGGETDLDLGNYERFLDITLTGRHNITSGKIYKEVIEKERRGDYLGKTVQIVPHATDAVQQWLKEVAEISVDGTGATPDVCLVEVGGTVGDIESMVFLEALRQFQFTVGRENILFVHVSLVPVLGSVGEQKTKPTQHSVKELRALGLSPDIIVCRSATLLSDATKSKISTFCHVLPSSIISVHDVTNIYHVPLILAQQGIQGIIKKVLGLTSMHPTPDLESWSNLAHTVDSFTRSVDIALVGKYTGLEDAYLSVVKALSHASMHLNVSVKVRWVEAGDLEEATKESNPEKHAAAWAVLRAESTRGVLIPGGFGVRGIEGMIAATRFARENKVPTLGICLGMQVMVIEHAINVLGLADATSAEFDADTTNPVVVFMPEINPLQMGGTMRLGSRTTLVATTLCKRDVMKNDTTKPTTETGCSIDSVDRTLASVVYGYGESGNKTVGINERHRHRYEVNPERVNAFEASGLYFTGRDETGVRMEVAERNRTDHPFFLGVQYHPELKSRPNRPSPPLFAFAAAACSMPERISQAGDMWREYGEGMKKETSWLYSPTRGLRKRPVSAFSSPAPPQLHLTTNNSTAVSTPNSVDAGASGSKKKGVKRTASETGASPGAGTNVGEAIEDQLCEQGGEQQEGGADGVGVSTGGYKLSKLNTLAKYSD